MGYGRRQWQRRPPALSLSALRRALVAAQVRADHAEAEAAKAVAHASDLAARNALLALQNEKMRRELYGQRSERSERLIDQIELAFEEAEATAGEDERLAALAAAKTNVAPFVRKRAIAPALSSAPAARARRHPGTRLLPGLRLGPAVAHRRGRDRDARGDPAPLEGDPNRARKGRLPPLRNDRAATRAVSRRPTRLGWTGFPRHAAVREVRPAPAAGPPARPLRARGCRSQPVDLSPTRSARAPPR